MFVANNSVQVGVRRIGTYGNVTVHWSSTQANSVDDSGQISLGTVQPATGSVTLSHGRDTAVFTVHVMHPFFHLCILIN